jgi:hypothetical protein
VKFLHTYTIKSYDGGRFGESSLITLAVVHVIVEVIGSNYPDIDTLFGVALLGFLVFCVIS